MDNSKFSTPTVSSMSTAAGEEIEAEIRNLICRMSREVPAWATPRIRSELRLLGSTRGEINDGHSLKC